MEIKKNKSDLVTTELKTVLCPLWASAERCKELFDISRGLLNRMANDGQIRKRKISEGQRGGTRYCVADLNDWFEGGAK